MIHSIELALPSHMGQGLSVKLERLHHSVYSWASVSIHSLGEAGDGEIGRGIERERIPEES